MGMKWQQSDDLDKLFESFAFDPDAKEIEVDEVVLEITEDKEDVETLLPKFEHKDSHKVIK
ncbi:MAG: hypothetical protein LBN08_04975 [Lactobacillales bacterium]|jgi:hypothetical protein|nr:hypothetical protein [Lactobacillales bacterium]